MSDIYEIVGDVDEIKFYWNYGLPPLKRNEIFFVSMSSRNKKLSEEERLYYKVSRSEMFAKQQIRHDSFKDFLKHLYRFEVNKNAYFTKNHMHYPAKTLVCYINICPIDAYKAMKDQITYLSEVLNGLTDSALKVSINGINDSFYKIRKSFDTCQSLFARNFGEKYWIDFDIDGQLDEQDYNNVKHCFYLNTAAKPGDLMMIKTGGGLHCFLKKTVLNMNPSLLISALYGCIENSKVTEIIHNKNEMCALPGTYMYGTEKENIVRIINKEDFRNIDPFKHTED